MENRKLTAKERKELDARIAALRREANMLAKALKEDEMISAEETTVEVSAEEATEEVASVEAPAEEAPAEEAPAEEAPAEEAPAEEAPAEEAPAEEAPAEEAPAEEAPAEEAPAEEAPAEEAPAEEAPAEEAPAEEAPAEEAPAEEAPAEEASAEEAPAEEAPAEEAPAEEAPAEEAPAEEAPAEEAPAEEAPAEEALAEEAPAEEAPAEEAPAEEAPAEEAPAEEAPAEEAPAEEALAEEAPAEEAPAEEAPDEEALAAEFAKLKAEIEAPAEEAPAEEAPAEEAPAEEAPAPTQSKRSLAPWIIVIILGVLVALLIAMWMAKNNETPVDPEDDNPPISGDVTPGTDDEVFDMDAFVVSTVNIANTLTTDEDVATNVDIFAEKIGADKLEELIEKYGELTVQKAIAEYIAFVPEIKMNQHINIEGLAYNPNAMNDYYNVLAELNDTYKEATGKNATGALMSLDGYDEYKGSRDTVRSLIAKSGDTDLLAWYNAKCEADDAMYQQVQDTGTANDYKEEIKLELVNNVNGSVKLLELQLEEKVSGTDVNTLTCTDVYKEFILNNYMYVVAN